jgi:hypothetical protein
MDSRIGFSKFFANTPIYPRLLCLSLSISSLYVFVFLLLISVFLRLAPYFVIPLYLDVILLFLPLLELPYLNS